MQPYLYFLAVLYFLHVLIGRTHDLVRFDPLIVSAGGKQSSTKREEAGFVKSGRRQEAE